MTGAPFLFVYVAPVMIAFYLAAFIIACAFIKRRGAFARWRWVWDILAAVISVPLVALLFGPVVRSFATSAGPFVFLITLPCLFGFGFGVFYSVVRRVVTR